MSLRGVRHDAAKVKRAFLLGLATLRTVHVEIDVRRAGRWGNVRSGDVTKARHDFQASACIVVKRDRLSSKGYMLGIKRKWGDHRCAAAYGTTPTAATKRALAALARVLR